MEQEERARVQRIRGRSVRTHFDVSGNLTGPYGARNDIYGKRKWERPRDIKAPGQANPEKLVVADLLCRYSYPQIIDEAPAALWTVRSAITAPSVASRPSSMAALAPSCADEMATFLPYRAKATWTTPRVRSKRKTMAKTASSGAAPRSHRTRE